MTAPEATILAALIGAAFGTGGWLLTWFISRKQRVADFRMAALEKRLETHQEAYKLWYEMVSVMHDRVKGPEAAIRCQQWWIGHCLYLDAKSRTEFDRCAHEVFSYRDSMDPKNPAETKARFDRIQHVFVLLAEGVHLPSIGENEGKTDKI